MLWYQFVVHTGPKANTNKTQHKQIYVVPQNRVRPRRQQIVYYWRNDTNTQLNPIQTHKTQCFHSYTRCFSQICTFSLSQLHCLPLSAHTFTVSALSIPLSFSICLHEKGKHKYSGWKRRGWLKKERVVDGCWEKYWQFANVDNLLQLYLHNYNFEMLLSVNIWC